MIEGTALFGVAMTRRRNRRILVVITYILSIAAVVSLGVVKHHLAALPAIMGFATLPFLIAYFVFGRLVSPFFLVPWFGHAPQEVDRGLGLAATVAPEEPPRDEREIAVRNSAFRIAYMILLVAGFVAFTIAEITRQVRHLDSGTVAYGITIFVIVLAITLPQAVVLWQERDVEQGSEQ